MSVTRERIIELGENLILTKGYNAFSYQDISTELGIKNAAVHYYFPTKANLGTSIVKTNILRFEEMIDNMHSRGFDEWKQLDAFIKIYIKSNREQKLCIFGSLGPDFDTLNENTQNELVKMTELIVNWLTEILTSGKEKGFFVFNEDSHNKAAMIFSSLVASLQLSRIVKNFDYKSFCQAIQEGLKS
ncbi:TetR/AcrR family transcriptional regulator [Maribellus sp. CM-23]|uniref:TetR/AcrR family transcriptional regulator n=1 Tax=Maribellus sp. CM-23 TaxID=2781026 RepID=UPI001F276B26|nr:TetR/AcrR family transcriptional regulator [Maribellus sp. CM-23]MCE4562691.1 TetR/AcrR family transcriptional regulator [Maribellus sp. CM-23]